MKRFYSILALVLSSFFLFSLKEVKADEYSFTITDTHFSSLDNLQQMKSLAEDYMSLYNYRDYILFYKEDIYYVAFYRTTSPYIKKRQTGSVISFRLNMSSPIFVQIFSSDFSSLSNTSSYPSQIYVFDSTEFFIYSSFDISFNYIDNNFYSFLYNEEVIFSFENDGVNFFPSLFDLYQVIYSGVEPEPELVDNTPFLTSFYTLCIEKISYLCNVVVSNYIYMSIFVIFLLIFLFELIFRRRL